MGGSLLFIPLLLIKAENSVEKQKIEIGSCNPELNNYDLIYKEPLYYIFKRSSAAKSGDFSDNQNATDLALLIFAPSPASLNSDYNYHFIFPWMTLFYQRKTLYLESECGD